MKNAFFAITYDVGTTGVKTCLFELGEKITLVESAYASYSLYISDGGKAEQDPNEWWRALCETTKTVLNKTSIKKEDIKKISFCSQMQSLVLVDKNLKPLRNSMSYMDSRAHKIFGKGPNILTLLACLYITGAAPTSPKDPVWKYNWVKKHEPEIYSKIYKWLDVKDYLCAKLTGNVAMTEGSAFATLVFDVRKNKRKISNFVCRILGVNPNHLPPVIRSFDKVGNITKQSADEIGLSTSCEVYGGGGDAELIGVGTGATSRGDTHIYLGTSGWVSTVTNKRLVDIKCSIASIVGADDENYNYFAEMETAGKCLEWVKDHLALDEIGVYLEKVDVVNSKETLYINLFDYLCEVVEKVPAGSGGVIFTPWLHGNRCPFDDPAARSMFFNIGLNTGKSELIRAVIEGIAFHCRSMLEAQTKKLEISDTIYLCGGGALSNTICQVMADVLGKKIAVNQNPQNVGALGAAALLAVSEKKIPSVRHAKQMLPEYTIIQPNKANKPAYDKNYKVFLKLYQNNKKLFKQLNL